MRSLYGLYVSAELLYEKIDKHYGKDLGMKPLILDAAPYWSIEMELLMDLVRSMLTICSAVGL